MTLQRPRRTPNHAPSPLARNGFSPLTFEGGVKQPSEFRKEVDGIKNGGGRDSEERGFAFPFNSAHFFKPTFVR